MSSLFVHVIERDMLAYRRQWMIFLTGFAEPLLYLLSIGVGVGALVGGVHVGGQTVDYDKFVAPGLLAVAAMNGSVFDTTFMRSFVDFDYVNLALIPLFLFSATFFPLSRYPTALQWVIQITPLYQGVVLVRSLAFGDLSWTLLLHAAYLVTMGVVGVRVAGRRLGRLLQP